MNFSKSLILTSVFLAATTISSATPIPVTTTTQFEVGGTFADGAVLAGWFDVSTQGTLAWVSSADMTVSGIKGDFKQLNFGGSYNFHSVWANLDLSDGSNNLSLDLLLAKGATSLQNYAGGALCNTSGNCGNVVSNYSAASTNKSFSDSRNDQDNNVFCSNGPNDPQLNAGSVSPEPGSTALLGAGLTAIGIFFRRRSIKK